MPRSVHRGHTLCEATCGLRCEGEALTMRGIASLCPRKCRPG